MPPSPCSLLCPESPHDVASWEWAPVEQAADGRPISELLAAEPSPLPIPHNPLLRQNAVNWILNVNEFYKFRPETAYLAVNYLDRFLSSNSISGQDGKSGGWPMQLLSVACVSVAAKMEETRVPLLLDLQIFDPKFVFEPKTVMRMELLLMSALKWQLRSVTPFDFVEHFGDLMKAQSIAVSGAGLLSAAANLIFKTCRLVEILEYRPSEIAGAAMICAFNEMDHLFNDRRGDLLRCFSKWLDEENVNVCVRMIENSVGKSRAYLQLETPQSPVGVIDIAACRSYDDSRGSSAVTTPKTKRRRVDKNDMYREHKNHNE